MSHDLADTEKFDSITHFLQAGGFNYRFFDMGRKVNRISSKDFEAIEGQEKTYPAPFQKKAWISLLFWEEGKQHEAVIWFLQFPIDELGFLKQEARDAFLIDILEQAGKNIQAKQSGSQVLDELNESPFAFKPSPDRLAVFHALATRELDQNPSQYYQHTRDYLSGKAGYEQWQFLGLQGIADVVARLDQDNNEGLLAKAINLMSEEPLVSFCSALENVSPEDSLVKALIKKLENELKMGVNNQLVSLLVRSLSGVRIEKKRHEILLIVLSSSLGNDIEVMVAISGRAWNDLRSPLILKAFVNNLAGLNQMAFDAILSDLMMIPAMRELILAELNDTKQSVELGDKLSQFMKIVGSTTI